MASFVETNREEFSVALPAALHGELCAHLLRDDDQEDAAFALYKPSAGTQRFTAVLYKVILPEEGDRDVHGNVMLHPQFFRRVCHLAAAEGAGVVLLHSHLGPGWQGVSPDDVKTELSYAEPAHTVTDLPFVGLTLGTDGTWSARVWEHANGTYERKFAATVRVVGKKLDISYFDRLRPRPKYKNIYKRTVTVWGEENHARLARLRVGVIGLGSVGSMVAEALARMGIERYVLLDFDEVQEHNLDRLLGATIDDLGQPKAHVAQRQIMRAATATHPEVVPVLHGVTEENGYRHALDCDVLFSCVDRPWPRYVLNQLAYGHLIPVIDGGIRVRFDSSTILFEGAEWQTQSVGPDRPCLQCLGAYTSADVATEREGLLDNPSYLEGLPHDHRFKRNENIFPFSANLASLEVMQLIEQVTGIGGTHYYGTQRYAYNQGYIRLDDGRHCETGCTFEAGLAHADTLYAAPIGLDHAAAEARCRQEGEAAPR